MHSLYTATAIFANVLHKCFCIKFSLSYGKNMTELNLKYTYTNVYEGKGEYNRKHFWGDRNHKMWANMYPHRPEFCKCLYTWGQSSFIVPTTDFLKLPNNMSWSLGDTLLDDFLPNLSQTNTQQFTKTKPVGTALVPTDSNAFTMYQLPLPPESQKTTLQNSHAHYFHFFVLPALAHTRS